MGGLGSGRRPSYCPTLDDFLDVDLRHLRRHDLLRPGYEGSLRWSRGGHEAGSIRFRLDLDALVLIYRVRDHGTQCWEEVSESVVLVSTRQVLGGERLWLACPGCTRRCQVLYGGRRFRCRHCVDVPYASQNEGAHDRLLRRAQDIRMRLGGSPSLVEPFPEKPKGMHWKTYARLQATAEGCTHASLMAAAKRLRLLPGELGKIFE